MKKKIVNLVCNKCGKLTTIEENAIKLRCYFCRSKNVEIGWEYSQSD